MKKFLVFPNIYPIHSGYIEFFNHPPKDWNIILPKIRKPTFNERLARKVNKLYISNKMYDEFYPDADLIFSMDVIYSGKKDWILYLIDNPYSLTSYDYQTFINDVVHHKWIEYHLSKDNCKEIWVSHSESYKTMKKYFSKKVMKKVKIKVLAINKQRKDVKLLLFMSSIKNPNDFYIKGGYEAMNTMDFLQSEAILIMRCKIPEELKQKIKKYKNIIVIEDELPESAIQCLYEKADALLQPSHTFMHSIFLEAIAHKLPVITLDTYAVRDYVQPNWKLISPSKRNLNQTYKNKTYPLNVRSKDFLNNIKNADLDVIDNLVKAVGELK